MLNSPYLTPKPKNDILIMQSQSNRMLEYLSGFVAIQVFSFYISSNEVGLRGKGKRGKGLNSPLPLPLFPNHKGDAKY
ncbi:hypothetical protein FDUTEX481_07754 [Tolypothrix sp. PCC 7601]|nr:hypothetical protein FDUTEX481_07754 [Tolypothrix sp. PCC 7601]